MPRQTFSMLRTLYFRLSAALVVLFLLIGLVLVLLTRYSADLYYQEVTQRLNAPIAMYVAGEAPLIRQGVVNTPALQRLAHQAMVINPSVEVYLLAPDGRVLSHDLGEHARLQSRVDLEPIRHFLADPANLPLQGDDPRGEGRRKIFTVAAVEHDGMLEGYVYVVLGGQKYEQLAATAGVSEVLRLTTLAVVGCVVFGLGSALLIFARLSRRLKVLTGHVNTYCVEAMGREGIPHAAAGDEVSQLAVAFDAMQDRMADQLEEIRRADQQRRDLVAAVSHDLRTPLATMQGYVETLALKRDEISAEQQKSYLDVVHHHGVRLGHLIDDLFELARLDSGTAQPQCATFCLADLVGDIAQEYRLIVEREGLGLRVEKDADDCLVWGDIHLIERVITNLLENALRHTPPGGSIALSLADRPGGVRLAVADTGDGIAAEDLPRIFDRGFRARTASAKRADSTGLGLAIVKRILELHDSAVAVQSDPVRGSEFSFVLRDRRAVSSR